MTDDLDIPPFYQVAHLSSSEMGKISSLQNEKKDFCLEHLEGLYARANPANLWKAILKYKCSTTPKSRPSSSSSLSEAAEKEEYDNLQLNYDGFRKVAYEILFNLNPLQTSLLSPQKAAFLKKIFFHHPFLSPASFLLFSKNSSEVISAVVVYAFIAKRLLLFRLRVELELVASVPPPHLLPRSTSEATRPCKNSISSPSSYSLCQEDVENFIARVLPHLRYARDMPHWMRPYFLCHASRKFMFMCDIQRVGTVSIDAFMKSEPFSELLLNFESDPQEVVITFPLGCPVEVPISVLTEEERENIGLSKDEETLTAVVVNIEGEGNRLEDVYMVRLICCEKELLLCRSQLFWNSGCGDFIDLDHVSSWFFLGFAERVYDHFTALDVDGDGVLTVEELEQYSESSFSKLVIHRVFEIHVPYSGGGRRVMDFKNYLNFVLATEYPCANASMLYLWSILDLDDTKAFISINTLRCFCKEIADELVARQILPDITGDIISMEIVDMINPLWHEHITLEDIIRSGHAETVFLVLLSFRNYCTYNGREFTSDIQGEATSF